MKENFETMMDLVDAVEHIKEKITFMGEVFAAVATKTETGGLTENALCGLYQIQRESEEQCASVSKALNYDFHVIKKSDKEVHLDNFCAAVDYALKKDRAGTKGA
jgi:hypothetical protein